MKIKGAKRVYKAHKHIHKTLRKHIPQGVLRAKKLFSFKYPKLFLLFLCIILAYYLFSQAGISSFIENLSKDNYLSIFLAGVFLALGFSAPFSIGFFILLQPENLLFASLIGGFGAMAGDMLIFKTIKYSFIKEFKELERKKIIRKIEKIVEKNKNVLIRHYLLYIFAGITIATPLPDEIGISMLAGLTTIKPLKLAIISFFLHSIAVFIILYLGVMI